MLIGSTQRRGWLFVLGLAAATILPLQTSRADAGNPPAPVYVAPIGTTDLVVQLLRADGESLRGSASILLTAGVGIKTLATAESKRHLERFRGVPLGLVHLHVVASGFAPVDLKLVLERPEREVRVTVYLRAETRDGVGGEGWLPELSTAASTHFVKTANLLHQGNLEKSRQQFHKLPGAELGDSNLQYLAGVLSYHSDETGMALFHFSQAVYLNPESQESARALAGLLYRTGNYGDAYEEFSRLAQKHPEDWELAWQAASAAFLSKQYAKARGSAQLAISLGGANAQRAEYLLAFSDAMLGDWPEGRAAAKLVLSQAKDPALAAMASDLFSAMDPVNAAAQAGQRALAPARAVAGLFPPDDLDPRVPLRMWAPPDVQGAMPKVFGGAPCNVGEVLQLAGRRVVARFDQLSEVAAKDEIEQAAVGLTGRTTPLGHFTADYMPEVLLLPTGSYSVREFLGVVIPEPSPFSAVVQGRAGLSEVFEPRMQADFTFACEGLTLWKGHPAWSVYFTERKDRPGRLGVHGFSGKFFPAYIRGRGFLDQASGELLHVETDLEDPIPALGLEEEHLAVDFTPVKFQSADEPYYLPSEAVLYINLRGHLYRVREDFKDYVRFVVGAKQEIRNPVVQP